MFKADNGGYGHNKRRAKYPPFIVGDFVTRVGLLYLIQWDYCHNPLVYFLVIDTAKYSLAPKLGKNCRLQM
jgi:hypothetical protein